MAKVIIDMPSEKIQPFIQLIVKLGIERSAIISGQTEMLPEPVSDVPFKPLILFSERFVLFDWEFFSNELEFE